MSLWSAKRVLRASFDPSLSNVLFSNYSLNFVISRTWGNVSLWLHLMSFKLLVRVLEFAWKHHYSVSLASVSSITVGVSSVMHIHFREEHLVSLVYYILRRRPFWENIGLRSEVLWATSLSTNCLQVVTIVKCLQSNKTSRVAMRFLLNEIIDLKHLIIWRSCPSLGCLIICMNHWIQLRFLCSF